MTADNNIIDMPNVATVSSPKEDEHTQHEQIVEAPETIEDQDTPGTCTKCQIVIEIEDVPGSGFKLSKYVTAASKPTHALSIMASVVNEGIEASVFTEIGLKQISEDIKQSNE